MSLRICVHLREKIKFSSRFVSPPQATKNKAYFAAVRPRKKFCPKKIVALQARSGKKTLNSEISDGFYLASYCRGMIEVP